MAIVLSILRKAHAMGTHHQLALDALSELPIAEAVAWERLFYRYIALYVDGAKAPDTAFKDFENHVLHPRHGYWGGAPKQAVTWYGETVDALKKQEWGSAAYAAGVLSHYITDPLQPLHTHQTDAENAIHAATEWTVSKTYADLRRLGLTLTLPAPDRAASIETLLRDGAAIATTHYETILAHYDIKRGVVAPEEGLDPVGRKVMAEMLVRASRLFALILGRAIAEAGVSAPEVSLAGDALRAFIGLPGAKRRRAKHDTADRHQIEAMYDELMATGHVEKTLPEDERKIRELFAAEVLSKATETPVALGQPAAAAPPLAEPVPTTAPAPIATSTVDADDLDPEDPAGAVSMKRTRIAVPQPRPAPAHIEAPDIRSRADAAVEAPADHTTTPSISATPIAALADMKPVQIAAPPTASVTPALASYRPSAARGGTRAALSVDAEVVDAPSIGAKTALKLNAVGIDTVGDFLKAHPIALAARLEDERLTPVLLTEWQDQTRLMCALGELRAADAKLLVGAGYRTVEAITNVEPDQLCADILNFALTKDGQALLRDGHVPDIEKIRGWASEARAVKAA